MYRARRSRIGGPVLREAVVDHVVALDAERVSDDLAAWSASSLSIACARRFAMVRLTVTGSSPPHDGGGASSSTASTSLSRATTSSTLRTKKSRVVSRLAARPRDQSVVMTRGACPDPVGWSHGNPHPTARIHIHVNLGIQANVLNATTENEIDTAFLALFQQKADALVIATDNVFARTTRPTHSPGCALQGSNDLFFTRLRRGRWSDELRP